MTAAGSQSQDTTTNGIGRDELLAAVKADSVTIVDALPAHAYAARHLPSAVNLVQDSPTALVRSALPDAAAMIVTYSTDQHCARGRDLAQRLRDLGYTDVRDYAEGIEDWAGHGLPLETGSSAQVKTDSEDTGYPRES